MNIHLTVFAVIILLSNSACSIYKAATQPPPADLTGLGIGTHREEVIGRLGIPTLSETDPKGNKRDMFEFESGFHQASKGRILLYAAADFFSLGLAELVLWPMELTLMERALCTARATYDASEIVADWEVSQKAGVQVQGC